MVTSRPLLTENEDETSNLPKGGAFMRSDIKPTPPPENRRPRRSGARRRARQKRQTRWGMTLLVVMLTVISVGAAGRSLSDQGITHPRGPSGPVSPPSAAAEPGDSTGHQQLSVNNTGSITVPSWVKTDLLPPNEYSRPGDALPQVNGVVVHYVGNPGTTAEQNRSYFANLAQTGEAYASSHFVVGMDGTVVQCVPLSEIAYCSTSRNRDTISIECCHPDTEGQFTRETMDSLVRLLNWLIDTYQLEREQVIRHYDVAGKECPIYYVRHPEAWEGLLNRLTFSK